jgi:ATP-binding cassette subfamily B protein
MLTGQFHSEGGGMVGKDRRHEIMQAAEELFRDRTTFAIAHRLSTLRNAGRLVVLKNGSTKAS